LKNRASTIWEKSSKSLENYYKFIERKNDRFKLELVDLLYVSNFKGGNSTINETEESLEFKLKEYSKVLRQINNEFGLASLSELSNQSVEMLIELANGFLDLRKKTDTAIDGFKASFLSTLLHIYFPNLYPILDRRLLLNLDLIEPVHLNKARQVKDIGNFYHQLIWKVREIQQNSNKSIREIDNEYFVKPLPEWAKSKTYETEN
jgi:hypothetical protein